jgi:hypothetical protein
MVSVSDIIQDDGNDGEGMDRRGKRQTAILEEMFPVAPAMFDSTCVVSGCACSRKNDSTI